jgi:hypothetical protein
LIVGRKNGHGVSLRGNNTAEEKWDAVRDGYVIQQIAGFEIVQPVHDEISAHEKLLGVSGREIFDMVCYGNVAVDLLKSRCRRRRLGPVLDGIIFVEQNLSLQIRFFDDVTIDEGERADASSCE